MRWMDDKHAQTNGQVSLLFHYPSSFASGASQASHATGFKLHCTGNHSDLAPSETTWISSGFFYRFHHYLVWSSGSSQEMEKSLWLIVVSHAPAPVEQPVYASNSLQLHMNFCFAPTFSFHPCSLFSLILKMHLLLSRCILICGHMGVTPVQKLSCQVFQEDAYQCIKKSYHWHLIWCWTRVFIFTYFPI